jgi:branched-chain amino acid transport system permease protein
VVSAPLAIAATTVLSAGFYWFAIRPAAGATMAQVVLLTIGFAICLRGVVTMAWGSDPMMVPSFTGEMPLNVGGVSILPQELWLIGVLVVITFATGCFFRHTVMGLALRAGATNPLGASFVGIDPRVLGLLAFAASGFLGAVAGAVWSPISFAQVDVGLGVALKGFTAAILGGLHSNYGPILGGIVLALIESFSAGYISSAYMDSITFGLMLLVLVLRPQGLLGTALSMTKEERPEEVLSTTARPTGFTNRDIAMVAIIVVVLTGLGLTMNGTWLTSGIFAGIMAIVVMGLVLLTGYGGQLSLGQGAFMMIGAYATGYLTGKLNWPSYAAMLIRVARRQRGVCARPPDLRAARALSLDGKLRPADDLTHLRARMDQHHRRAVGAPRHPPARDRRFRIHVRPRRLFFDRSDLVCGTDLLPEPGALAAWARAACHPLQ